MLFHYTCLSLFYLIEHPNTYLQEDYNELVLNIIHLRVSEVCTPSRVKQVWSVVFTVWQKWSTLPPWMESPREGPDPWKNKERGELKVRNLRRWMLYIEWMPCSSLLHYDQLANAMALIWMLTANSWNKGKAALNMLQPGSSTVTVVLLRSTIYHTRDHPKKKAIEFKIKKIVGDRLKHIQARYSRAWWLIKALGLVPWALISHQSLCTSLHYLLDTIVVANK